MTTRPGGGPDLGMPCRGTSRARYFTTARMKHPWMKHVYPTLWSNHVPVDLPRARVCDPDKVV